MGAAQRRGPTPELPGSRPGPRLRQPPARREGSPQTPESLCPGGVGAGALECGSRGGWHPPPMTGLCTPGCSHSRLQGKALLLHCQDPQLWQGRPHPAFCTSHSQASGRPPWPLVRPGHPRRQAQCPGRPGDLRLPSCPLHLLRGCGGGRVPSAWDPHNTDRSAALQVAGHEALWAGQRRPRLCPPRIHASGPQPAHREKPWARVGAHGGPDPVFLELSGPGRPSPRACPEQRQRSPCAAQSCGRRGGAGVRRDLMRGQSLICRSMCGTLAAPRARRPLSSRARSSRQMAAEMLISGAPAPRV